MKTAPSNEESTRLIRDLVDQGLTGIHLDESRREAVTDLVTRFVETEAASIARARIEQAADLVEEASDLPEAAPADAVEPKGMAPESSVAEEAAAADEVAVDDAPAATPKAGDRVAPNPRRPRKPRGRSP